MISYGDRVQDASIVNRYGSESALVGTVVRVYDYGMVCVEWELEEWDESDPFEDVWPDELTLA